MIVAVRRECPPGPTSSSSEWSADVRRLRRPRARPRRRAAGLFRPVRAAAPRPGVGRDRGQRERPADDACATSGSSPQVFDEQSLSALRGELAIGHTRYSTTGGNAWANAQPMVHHGRARTVALGHNGNLVNAEELRAETRQAARLDLRLRGDRGADRRRRAAARGGGRGDDGAARGRRDGRRPRRRHALRLPRPARLPAARARPARRRPGRRVRELRPRPRRRDGSSARSAPASW